MSERLSDEQLAADLALSEAATPGPWYANVNDLVGGWQVSTVALPASENDPRGGAGFPADFCNEADAAFIAAAGSRYALALRELQQAREALREARRLAATEKDHVWTADDACEQIAAVADAALGGRS